LKAAALEEIRACAAAGGPSGKIAATVVLRPVGRSEAAAIQGRPVEGSPSGECALRVLGDMRVLGFHGAPISLAFEAVVDPPASPPAKLSKPAAADTEPDPNCAHAPGGRLAPEVIQRGVRDHFSDFRRCYEDGLRRDPTLVGRAQMRFVIGRDGKVSSVSSAGSDLPDLASRACLRRAFARMEFPAPSCGIVTVTYPIQFSPGG
jgi:hypothetical protein